MAIYNSDGTELIAAYDANGNPLVSAYNANGQKIWDSGTPKPSLKVMTYNVQKFTGINAQQAMQNEIISKYNADIIGVQELGNSPTLPTIGQNMFTDYPYRQMFNHKNYHMIATKAHPMENVSVSDYSVQDPNDISSYNETRGYVKADITVGGKTITLINTHLCLYPPYLYQQMSEVFALAEQCEYVIVTGDFNSGNSGIDSSSYINMYKQFVDAGYNLANNSPASGWQNTYTSSATATSLAELSTPPDTIIVSGNIDINNVIFDTTKFSYLNGSAIDHIAVIADLTIN